MVSYLCTLVKAVQPKWYRTFENVITLGREELLLAATNYSWTLIITPGRK